MSYQFEDDSALEELLNQQLSRRRPTVRPAQAPAPAPAPATSGPTSDEPKSKFSGWLERQPATLEPPQTPESQHRIVPPAMPAPAPVSSLQDRRQPASQWAPNADSIGSTLPDDETIQAMSKAALVSLVVDQVRPQLAQLASVAQNEAKTVAECGRLGAELAAANQRQGAIDERWMSLSKQLEARLERAQQELATELDRRRKLVEELETEHRGQMQRLEETYERRLADCEAEWRRRLERGEEFHRQEIASSARTSEDLRKLQETFAEWNRQAETNLGRFGAQLRQVDCLIETQTDAIRQRTEEETSLRGALGKKLAELEHRIRQLGELAGELRDAEPRVAHTLAQNQELIGELSAYLQKFVTTEEDLRARELTQQSLQNKLAEERLQVAMERHRLEVHEERAKESLQERQSLANERQQVAEQRRQLEESERQASLRLADLQAETFRLHLSRKRLASHLERVAEQREQLVAERRSRSLEAGKLRDLRQRLKRELEQYSRLKKSLVCSICMGRLCELQSEGFCKQFAPVDAALNQHPSNPSNLEQQLDSLLRESHPIPGAPFKDELSLEAKENEDFESLFVESRFVQMLKSAA